ncbi:MAG: signal peptidase II [Candidatus Curtissbacteria bacterium]|nr:signal peptidase II [Candidatus Curtissbacteria bacterium]
MKRKWKRKDSFFLIIPSIIVLDQITKLLVVKLGIQTVCNRGFAFGIAPTFLNGLISILVLGVVAYLAIKETRGIFLLGYFLIIAGGLSNFFDRLARGCVLDFVDLKIWPVFNLADSAISIGVFVLVIFGIFKFKINA